MFVTGNCTAVGSNRTNCLWVLVLAPGTPLYWCNDWCLADRAITHNALYALLDWSDACPAWSKLLKLPHGYSSVEFLFSVLLAASWLLIWELFVTATLCTPPPLRNCSRNCLHASVTYALGPLTWQESPAVARKRATAIQLVPVLTFKVILG